MYDLKIVAFGTGLQDGFNPCIFMTCAFFIAQGLWGSVTTIKIFWLRLIFVLTYLFGVLNFNFGLGQIIILRKDFMFAAKIIYFILGVGAFIAGLIFLKDWFLMHRNKGNSALMAQKEIMPWVVSRKVAYTTTILLALFLSALASLSPISNYMYLLSSTGVIKGQVLAVLPLILIYILMSIWPLWMVWGVSSIKNIKPTLLKIFSAFIFFTASLTAIFLFK